MKQNQEPTEADIQAYMFKSGENWYTSRETLREFVYREDHNKPDGMTWGDYWKTY